MDESINKIGIKSFRLDNLGPSSALSPVAKSFPSLTHLEITLYTAMPSTISQLMTLRLLTDLRLYCFNFQLGSFTALQPLAHVLSYLYLDIASVDDCQLSYLLPFRALTSLQLYISPPRSTTSLYSMHITSAFLREHWDKLEKQAIQLTASVASLVRVLGQLISLSTPPLSQSPSRVLATSGAIASSHTNGSDNNGENDTIDGKKNSLVFGLRLSNITLDDLNKFFAHMELSSLFIPSPSLSSTPLSSSKSYPRTPTISLECILRYGRGEVEALRIQSLERDMYEQFKLRGYTNVSCVIVPICWND
jgi:hypothetical protein